MGEVIKSKRFVFDDLFKCCRFDIKIFVGVIDNFIVRDNTAAALSRTMQFSNVSVPALLMPPPSPVVEPYPTVSSEMATVPLLILNTR